MAVLPESLKQGFRFHAFYPIFSCGVNLSKNKDIGVIKSSEKIFEQGLRPRITMRLKYSDDPFPPTGPCCLQCGHNLYRMMTIIIHNEDSLLLSFDLKPSLNPAKIAQRFLDDPEGNIQLKSCG